MASVIGHLIFFVFALALVGFEPMIINLVLAAWSYSCYLTLKGWSVLLLMFFMAASTYHGMVYTLDRLGQTSFM